MLAFPCRVRQSLGFGVHSPFMYQLIAGVFYERIPYYSYGRLMRVRPVKGLPGCPVKTNKLLFRLVNYFQPSDIMEFGTGNGMSAVWMSSAKKCDSVMTCDGPDSCDDGRMERFFSEYPAIRYVPSFPVNELKAFLEEKKGALGFVHIAHTDKYEEIFETLLGKVNSDTVIAIENISGSSKRKWWKKIECDERTGITVDLYDTGIVLFDKKYAKRAYRLIF